MSFSDSACVPRRRPPRSTSFTSLRTWKRSLSRTHGADRRSRCSAGVWPCTPSSARASPNATCSEAATFLTGSLLVRGQTAQPRRRPAHDGRLGSADPPVAAQSERRKTPLALGGSGDSTAQSQKNRPTPGLGTDGGQPTSGSPRREQAKDGRPTPRKAISITMAASVWRCCWLL